LFLYLLLSRRSYHIFIKDGNGKEKMKIIGIISSCLVVLALIFLVTCSKKEGQPPPPPVPVVEKKPEPPAKVDSTAIRTMQRAEKSDRAMEEERQQHAHRPKYHVFETLTNKYNEYEGYGLYTYVLFRIRVDDPSLDSKTKELYQKLLTAIIKSTPTPEEVNGIWPISSTNIFYIPGKESFISGNWSLTNYNSSLAMTYIAQLCRIAEENSGIPKRMLSRPGPFLISTLKPLGDTSTASKYILYADLFDSHPEAMMEIVESYKNYVVTASVEDVEMFKTLRLSLLNFILKADDNLKIVKTALADWR
jgi:hypothetical protein